MRLSFVPAASLLVVLLFAQCQAQSALRSSTGAKLHNRDLEKEDNDSPAPKPSPPPSDYPSIVPTSWASVPLDELPSDFPSLVPSDAPSLVPSDAPSLVPSTNPSSVIKTGSLTFGDLGGGGEPWDDGPVQIHSIESKDELTSEEAPPQSSSKKKGYRKY